MPRTPNYKRLGANIRTQHAKYQQLTKELLTELDQLKKQCDHQATVILCSAYAGSYSWDRDDAHDEYRQCLVCGCQESAAHRDKFQVLTQPVYRLELGWPWSSDSAYQKSPLKNCLNHPISELVAWVEKIGWPTARVNTQKQT